MKPLVILASSRGDGNTRSLVDLCFKGRSIVIRDLSSMRLGCYSYSGYDKDDEFIDLVIHGLACRPWFMATPLYWYSMSATAKTFIDRFTDLITTHKALGRSLRGLPFGVICSGTDPATPEGFSVPFELTCRYLGMKFLGVHYAQYADSSPMSEAAGEQAQAFVHSAMAASKA